MNLAVVILSLLLFLGVASAAARSKRDGNFIGDESIILFGNGRMVCEERLPALSVAKDTVLSSKTEFNEFIEKNPMIVMGLTDSTCAKCCETEPILEQILEKVKDKAILSYPEVNKKKKKIVRKEIKVARIDTSDDKFVEEMLSSGTNLAKGGPSIVIVINGMFFKYDGMYSDVNMLVHQMQRIATPTV